MAEDLGPTFVSLTDEDGKDITLEFIDSFEFNGTLYHVFLPTESDDEAENADDESAGLIILKVIEENGEELLATMDSDEEEQAVYDFYSEQLFEDED